MGFFDTCGPEFRFSLREYPVPYGKDGLQYTAYDWDQRRMIHIVTSWRDNVDDDFYLDCLQKNVDNLPADVVLFEVARNGSPVFWTNHTDNDGLLIPFYPRSTDYPDGVPMISRMQLEEVGRMGIQVDHASYCPSDEANPSVHVAFKYYFSNMNMRAIWHEANCLLRIPAHPGIVPLHSLVIDRINGDDDARVVGFATPFIEGGTVESNVHRLFKLKYLQQLFDAIDFLNLQLGIVHGDIHMRNLLIEQESDNIKHFDFNWSAKLGWEGEKGDYGAFAYDVDRNDVKDATFTVYEILTRDTHFRDEHEASETHASMVMDIKEWTPHSDVLLDAQPAEYREALELWVQARANKDNEITHFEQTPGALAWPPLPQFDLVWDCGAEVRSECRLRQSVIRYGEKFLSWQRSPSSDLPLGNGRISLVTGEVIFDSDSIDEEEDEPRQSKRIRTE